MDLLNKSVIQEIISDIKTSQNRVRREKEIKAYEVYSGALKDHVHNRIMQLYPKTYSSFSIADLNLTKKITDKKSRAYNQAPVRVLESEDETEFYSRLMKQVGSTEAWQTFDVYYNLHKYAAMWFSYVGDRIVLRPLTPFQFSRVVNSFGDTEVFVVNFPTSDMFSSLDLDGRNAIIQDSEADSSCERYAFWTDTQHVVVRYYEAESDSDSCRIVYEAIPDNPNYENPLGIIPAVFAQQGDNSVLPILNPLCEQTIEYNQQYSVMLTGCSVQTFGHLILKHPEDQMMPSEIYNSLFTYSRLPQVEGAETSLEYLNPSPNIQSNLEVLNNYGHQIVTEHLGDGAQKLNGSDNYASGLDRMIAMSDITNLIEQNQQVVYARAENGLYQIIKRYYEAKNDITLKSESLTVKYPKPKPVQSEKEILENIEKKLSLGLIQRHEALMMLDPNMDAEAAKSKIEVIKEENKSNISDLIGMDNGEINSQNT